MNDLEQLPALDPFRDWEPPAERRARSAAFVERLVTTETRRPARARPRLLVGAVALAAAVAAGVVLVPRHNDSAYASWTATPDELAGIHVLPQARQCAQGWGEQWRTPPAASDVVLAEQRGIATLLLVVKDETEMVDCIVLDPARGAAGAELLGDSGSPAPAGDRATVLSMGATGDQEWYSQVVGRAGPAVTRVDIERPDGTLVHASLRDGWWAAWWPGREGGDADGVRIVVHTATGSRTAVPSRL